MRTFLARLVAMIEKVWSQLLGAIRGREADDPDAEGDERE